MKNQTDLNTGSFIGRNVFHLNKWIEFGEIKHNEIEIRIQAQGAMSDNRITHSTCKSSMRNKYYR